MITNDPPDQPPGPWHPQMPSTPGSQPPAPPPGSTIPGYPPPGYQYPQQAPPVERTGRAVAALVLGIVGLFIWILAPLAIGFGISALRKARGRQVTGKGAAVAGLVLGILGTIVLAAVIAGIAASAGGGSGTAGVPVSVPTSASAGATTQPSARASTTTQGAGIGSAVRDGKFQFVITRVSHRKSVGPVSLGLGEAAQGEFTVLHIKVTNIGTQSQTLDDSSQFVFDAKGRKFDANSSADIQANPNGGGAFLNDINPGNSVHAVLLFDLPKGDKAVQAELHDSAFSGGVTVSLTH